MTLSLAIYLGLLVVCCGYAFLRGGAPERIGVAILLVAIVASNLVPKRAEWHFVYVEIEILLVDTVMLAAVGWLALQAQRYWPIWWAGLKLCSVIVHLMMFVPLLMPWSYSVASVALSFIAPVLLAIATVQHRQRLTQYGADPAWSVAAHWRGDEGSAVAPSSEPR